MSVYAAQHKFIGESEYDSYSDYLKSPHWKETKSRFLSGQIRQCAICKEKRWLDVHHRIYKTLGCERGEDLVILCRKHHTELHELARNMSLESALETLKANREWEVAQKRKQYKQAKSKNKKQKKKRGKKRKRKYKKRLQSLFR